MVDLDNGQPGGPSKNTETVRIHLAAGGVDGQMSQPRNLALVLKSARPVRWVVTSSPILSGPLTVLAEHPVDTSGISARQKADVKSDQTIPSAFAMLILQVTADLGPPVSYVRTSPATNRIEVVVGRKLEHFRPSSLHSSTYFRNVAFFLSTVLHCIVSNIPTC